MSFNREQYSEILKSLSLENKLIKLPSMIAYQEEQVVLAQKTYDLTVNDFDLEKARIDQKEYAKARIEGYSQPLAKANAEVLALPFQSAVIKTRTDLSLEKLCMKFLENEFTSIRKQANLKEAEITHGI